VVASGNRLLSFFIFLSGCDAGGCTAFPRLRQRFPPEAGAGLVWYNLDRDGAPDERTLHAGEPVERGEKWGLNIWLRERPRRPPTARVRALVRARADGAVRLCLSVSPVAPPSTRCAGCGDIETPLGLCLCRSKYGEEPVAAPPERIPIYCDGTAVFRRTTLFSREPS